ncbi:MAG: hypothetical protein B6U68_02810 [Candidatus Aenigmarchaeota archaeon ex4484_14]|nr:MAG: hypothetical protein B6U68_02810 [Candidatus Aenigmarchaeota archaeon ex4484_14]
MREFIEETAKTLNVEKHLLEKDILLHQILLDLSKTKICEEFTFKGGSCLIKHYLNYFRFSEDLDFTFIDQGLFKGASQKRIRQMLSKKIQEIGNALEDIAKKRNLDFKFEKHNKRYIEIGSSNKTATFKLWYISIDNMNFFIKLQINFVEKILFPIKKARIRSLAIESKELKFLFPNLYKEYTTKVMFNVYDIREILCEKIRAILTRRGIKERDFIDVYLVSKKFKIDPDALRSEIITKTRFALFLYRKYRQNLDEKTKLLSVDMFPFGSEEPLLLMKIEKSEFYSFLVKFMTFLEKIMKML